MQAEIFKKTTYQGKTFILVESGKNSRSLCGDGSGICSGVENDDLCWSGYSNGSEDGCCGGTDRIWKELE